MNSTASTNESSGIPEVQEKLKRNLEREFAGKLIASEPHAWRQYGLTFELKPDGALEIFRTLKSGQDFLFNMLIDITAVDYLDSREPRFGVVYQLLSLTHHHRLCLKISVDEAKPEVESIRSLWEGANFLEREVWDMYGITFRGHGDLRRILMYDEFVGHPLRKDYPLRAKQPRVQMRIPELRNTSPDMEREVLVSLPVRPGGRKGTGVANS